jgi:F-type H+-transporting ATPase subunit b
MRARCALFLSLAFVLSGSFAPPAYAQEEAPAHHHKKGVHSPGGGGADEPGETEGEASGANQDGIVNWWSFDYGAAAKDPTHHDWPPPFGWALVNFVIFLFILAKILWQPLTRGWAERHDQIKGELDEATRLRKEAEAQLATYQQKVSNVDNEVQTLLKQLHADAEADRARIIANAESEAKRVREEADRQIKVEIERARIELRRETVAAALKAAETILKQNVREEDQRRLADKYVADLDRAAAQGKGGAA